MLREAARTASRRGAHEHAVELLRHCVPEDADSVDDPALMVELGLSEVRSDPEAGIGRLLRALPLLTAPDRRLTVLTALIGAMVRTGQVPRAVELLRIRRAEAVAAGEGPAGAHVLEAHLLLTSNTSHRAFRQVLDAASFGLDPAPDTAGGRALLAARAVISVSRLDGVAESLAAARAVLLHGTPPADAPATLGSAAAVLLYTDRPDEAETALRRLLEGADVLDDWQHATLLALCADAYERQGALDRALAATADALRGRPPSRRTAAARWPGPSGCRPSSTGTRWPRRPPWPRAAPFRRWRTAGSGTNSSPRGAGCDWPRATRRPHSST